MKNGKKQCCECNQVLSKDEIALCKKLIGVETDDLYCIECLGSFLECTVEDLEIKIQEFKEAGCTLFL